MTAPAGPAVGRAHFPALGGTAVVLSTEPDRIDLARAAVRAQVEAIDTACSRFRADSELSLVNASAGAGVSTVSALFAQALETALRAARLTDGDVDPTCGAALDAAGYDRDFGELGTDGLTITVSGHLPASGYRSIEWDPERRAVRLPPGCRLDFGATAKALAADLAAASALAAARCGVLVNLSGDISVAGTAPEGGWRIRVTDDHRSGDDAPGQSITLAAGGLATSSTTVRRWETADGPAHHILVPGTGMPAEVYWRTVSVAAATCVDANIAATAAILRGDRAPRWLAAQGLPARLVRRDGSSVTVGSWPAEHAAPEAGAR
jgi:thiamine biosynthesis lipoprotein